ncbi:glycine/betaine ABC transporter substrate-binding protein [Epidermidibacterium keratini]|uniref:Glycine/betaine ABC transporter substrate-binding protein n=1 Tax=Epidermidibacterium keratini TaxID=1891644 RepID=A0A7L4YLP0_9ACTN|nr:ABC transporter substrate-binding protein [Epidermidibacterium keratini]QHB99743.1 glycine/betaine ABC transporter substrate-binding protein [Epidermidibacterium keratini]
MRTRILAAAAAAFALVLTGCGSGDPTQSDSGGGEQAPADTIVIGSANFPENELLAEIYAGALEAKDVKVDKKLNIGARELYLKALDDGSIDLIPEYNGSLLAAFNKDVPQDVTTPEQVYDALVKSTPDGLAVLEQSEAEDKDTLTVTSQTAQQYNLQKISDLDGVAGELALGGPPEFAERYQGVLGLKDLYGIEFKSFTPYDTGGPLTLEALLSGQAQVVNLFSTDSAIVTNDLVSLEDDKNLFSSQNVVPLIRESKANDTVKEALNAVSASMTTEDLTKYLAMVQVDKKSASEVAKQYLTDKGLN